MTLGAVVVQLASMDGEPVEYTTVTEVGLVKSTELPLPPVEVGVKDISVSSSNFYALCSDFSC